MKKIKYFLLHLFLLLNLFALFSCNNSNYELKSFIEDGKIIITIDGVRYYHNTEYELKEISSKPIGTIKVYNARRSLFVNPIDTELKYIYARKTSIIRDKDLAGIFVREDITLPKLEEITNYKLTYNGKEYQIDIPKYYMTESKITKIDLPCILLNCKIEFEDDPLIFYSLTIYQNNENYYIKNYDNKYVLLEDFTI